MKAQFSRSANRGYTPHNAPVRKRRASFGQGAATFADGISLSPGGVLSPVPGPIVGAGLPGLSMAWWPARLASPERPPSAVFLCPWRAERFPDYLHFQIAIYGPAMPTSEEYRRSADECLRLANEAEDPHEREVLIRIAAQWDRLAAYKAQLEDRA